MQKVFKTNSKDICSFTFLFHILISILIFLFIKKHHMFHISINITTIFEEDEYKNIIK